MDKLKLRTSIMSYRHNYQLLTGEVLTSDYHVHHLDGDWTNSDISNLIKINAWDHRMKHKMLVKVYLDNLRVWEREEKEEEITYIAELLTKNISERNERLEAIRLKAALVAKEK